MQCAHYYLIHLDLNHASEVDARKGHPLLLPQSRGWLANPNDPVLACSQSPSERPPLHCCLSAVLVTVHKTRENKEQWISLDQIQNRSWYNSIAILLKVHSHYCCFDYSLEYERENQATIVNKLIHGIAIVWYSIPHIVKQDNTGSLIGIGLSVDFLSLFYHQILQVKRKSNIANSYNMQ